MIAVFDLIEAEGRSLRHNSVRISWAVGFAALTVVFALGGLVLLLWAIYQGLSTQFGHPAAGALTGLLTLISAVSCAWIAKRIVR